MLDLDDQDHKRHTYMIMNNTEFTFANVHDKLLESRYPEINETWNVSMEITSLFSFKPETMPIHSVLLLLLIINNLVIKFQ